MSGSHSGSVGDSAAESSPVGLTALMRQSSTGPTTQIRPPSFRWGTRVAIPGAITIGTLCMLLLAAGRSLAPAIDVEVSPVVERSVKVASSTEPPMATVDKAPRQSSASAIPPGAEPVAQAAGWIEADPYLHEATSLAEGIVAEVLVLEGEAVEKGQVVARLDPDDALLALRRMQAEVAIHAAHIAEARAALRAAQETWDRPYLLDTKLAAAEARVVENEALATQLAAELAAGESTLERLRADFDRIAPLADSGAVPVSDKTDARTLMQEQASKVEALRRRLEVVRAQSDRAEAELSAARSDRELRIHDRRQLDSAKAALARAEAEHHRYEATLAEAELRVKRLEVRAPISGIVVERFKYPGSKIMLGMDDPHSASVVSIYDPEKLQVRVDVPLADAAKLSIGQRVGIVAESLPTTTFAGRITRILHMADVSKNTLQVKVAIEEPSLLLRPETLARATFYDVFAEEDKRAAAPSASPAPDRVSSESSLWIRSEALRDGDVVWVVTEYDGEYGIAERRTATLADAPAERGWVAIVSGVAPGDLVVRRADGALSDGARVRVRTVPAATTSNHDDH